MVMVGGGTRTTPARQHKRPRTGSRVVAAMIPAVAGSRVVAAMIPAVAGMLPTVSRGGGVPIVFNKLL